jgi:kynurenine formamidase
MEAIIMNNNSSWPFIPNNWGRWDNDKGTINTITPQVVLDAVGEVSVGRVIPCSHELVSRDYFRDSPAFLHEMMYVSNDPHSKDVNVQSACDSFQMKIHGMLNTHIDALCHTGFKQKAFNGHQFDEMVTVESGAKKEGLSDILAVVTRGVLADIPKVRGLPYLQPGDPVTLDDLKKAAPDLRSGDALLVRTGRWRIDQELLDDRSYDPHGRFSGIHEECMSYLGEKDISILGTDGPGDNFPSTIKECKVPVHILSLVWLGIHLIHHMDLELLGEECCSIGKNTFLFCVSSLNIPGATGSPTTPVAIL